MNFNDKETLKSGALDLARKGYKIFPIYGLDENGVCTCKSGQNCKSPGKHPALSTQWKSRATTETETIEKWWFKEAYNIGLLAGGNDLLILDIDSDEGLAYFEEKAKLEPESKNTVCQKTGKGYHYFYRYDETRNGEQHNRTKFKPGLDIRCKNGYVLASPSNHYLGEPYQWINDLDTHISDIPNWLLDDLKETKKEETILESVGVKTEDKSNTQIRINEGRRNDCLYKIAANSNRIGLPFEDILDEILKYNLKYCLPPLHNNEVRNIALSASGYLSKDDLFSEDSSEKLDQEADRIINEVWSKAKNIMVSGDPLNYVLDCFNKRHIGDRHISEYILLMPADQQIKNAYGLHADIFGSTGTGKSDSILKTFQLMPKNAYIVADMSNKALFYHPIPNKIILYIDDYKQSEEMDNIIRKTTSNFKEKSVYLTLDSNREAVELALPSEISWVISSVKAEQDNQNLSRVVILNADESEDTNRKVAELQINRVSEGIDQNKIDDEILICRKIIEDFRNREYIVKIPFIKEEDVLSFIDLNQRRNINIFLDIVMSITVWNWRQRDYDKDSKVLIATRDDYNKAKDLWRIISGNTETKLTNAEIELIQTVWNSKDPVYHVISREKLIKELKITSGRLSQLCNGKYGKNGLTDKVTGFEYGKITVSIDGSEKNTKISSNKYYVDVRNLDGFIRDKLELKDLTPEEKEKEKAQNLQKNMVARTLADEDTDIWLT